MINRYKLTYDAHVGIVATADAALRNLFSVHPREVLLRPSGDGKSFVAVSEKKPWLIHLGRRLSLRADDHDGTRFLEAFLDEVLDSQEGFSPLSGQYDQQLEERWITVVETYEESLAMDDDSGEEDEGEVGGNALSGRSTVTRISAWVTRKDEGGEMIQDNFDDGDEAIVDGLIDDSLPPPSLDQLKAALEGPPPQLPDNDGIMPFSFPHSSPIDFPPTAQKRFLRRLDNILSYGAVKPALNAPKPEATPARLPPADAEQQERDDARQQFDILLDSLSDHALPTLPLEEPFNDFDWFDDSDAFFCRGECHESNGRLRWVDEARGWSKEAGEIDDDGMGMES
jgi:hypothetical protein